MDCRLLLACLKDDLDGRIKCANDFTCGDGVALSLIVVDHLVSFSMGGGKSMKADDPGNDGETFWELFWEFAGIMRLLDPALEPARSLERKPMLYTDGGRSEVQEQGTTT